MSIEVYAAQPREGTETVKRTPVYSHNHRNNGLCSSTPRGDGNLSLAFLEATLDLVVYAAQPREGTETGADKILYI